MVTGRLLGSYITCTDLYFVYFIAPQMTAIQFGNTTEGISDSTVFNIPDYCDKDVDGSVIG